MQVLNSPSGTLTSTTVPFYRSSFFQTSYWWGGNVLRISSFRLLVQMRSDARQSPPGEDILRHCAHRSGRHACLSQNTVSGAWEFRPPAATSSLPTYQLDPYSRWLLDSPVYPRPWLPPPHPTPLPLSSLMLFLKLEVLKGRKGYVHTFSFWGSPHAGVRLYPKSPVVRNRYADVTVLWFMFRVSLNCNFCHPQP